jgi:iron complex outermembrane receptor protein
LHFIVGTKAEYDSLTDLELQPGARLLWTPNERNTVWGSMAHAVRVPSRYQEDSTVTFNRFMSGPIPGQASLSPNTQLTSETLDAFELGYRFQPNRRFSLDLAVFYNEYDNLIGTRTLPPKFAAGAATPHISVPIVTANNLTAESYGGELAATWNVAENWKLAASYSLLELQVHGHDGADSDAEHYIEESSHKHQVQLRSYLDITRDIQLNALANYVAPLSGLGVPGYVRLDLNIVWRPKENLELAVGVQNLLDNRHPEFTDVNFQTVATESQRSYFVSLNYRYEQ